MFRSILIPMLLIAAPPVLAEEMLDAEGLAAEGLAREGLAAEGAPEDGLPEAQLPGDDAAIAVFTATFGTDCMGAFLENGGLIEPPARYEVKSPSRWGAPVPMVVWQFRCDIYAYNTAQVFLISTDLGGVVPVGLARPTLRIEYDEAAEAPGEADSVVSLLEIDGWSADSLAINAGFDPQSRTISAHSLWRGIGDASDAGLWRLQDGQFQLVLYQVDASYDGKYRPVTLVDFR